MVRRGQVLVVVLLVLAVVLTLGLSITSRGITEVNVSTVEDDSSRSLDAAEAGVESALGALITPGPAVSVGGTTASYILATVASGAGTGVAPAEKIRAGDTATIFLSGRDANGNLLTNDPAAFNRLINICWGDGATIDQFTPAMEARLYYYDGASANPYGVGGVAYDPSLARIGRNRFSQTATSGTAPCTTSGRTYYFWVSDLALTTNFGMPLGAKPLLLKVKLLYNGDTGHFVGVEASGAGTNNFPNQGVTITSAGTYGSTVRKLSVFQRYPEFTGLFDGPLFAGSGGLIKP